MRSEILEALGGEAGCMRLSTAFYARVGKDPVLRPLFPGKTLRCATEEFAAFLVQFLGGDEAETQHRWWLSLRESHARFEIDASQRSAWLRHMAAALEGAGLDDRARKALRELFLHSSAYVSGHPVPAEPSHEELAARWREQRDLDDAIAAIAGGDSDAALGLAPRFASRPSVYVGLLVRMLRSARAPSVRYVVDCVERQPNLAAQPFSGKLLLHFAAGAGCVEVVAVLLRLGGDVDALDRGGHTALYCVSNECGGGTGAEVVRMLVGAGANVNACGGVTRATPLHMAARRGFVEIARTLLDCGASINARDSKGDTPLQRAINCRRGGVSELLLQRGAAAVGRLRRAP